MILENETGGLRADASQAIIDFWKGIPHDYDGLPSLDQLDPVKMPGWVLQHVFVVQLIPGQELKAEIRLQGEYIVNKAGQNLAGCCVDEAHFGQNFEDILETYRMVARHRRPFGTHEQMTSNAGVTKIIEVVHLPFAAGCCWLQAEVHKMLFER